MNHFGSHKRYCGLVSGTSYFNEWESAKNTFGYYVNDHGSRTAFITGDEVGSILKEWTFDSDEVAIGTLFELAQGQNYLQLCRDTIRHFEDKEPALIAYLQKEYDYSEARAKDALAYLWQVKMVAFEFAYYVEHGDFLPDKYACTAYGYTAKRLSHETSLTILGAFNYMIYLNNKPEKALANLKKGLHMRRIIFKLNDKEEQTPMEEKTQVQNEELEQVQENTCEEPEQTQAPPDETESVQSVAVDSAIVEKLEALEAAVAGLQQCFDDKIAEDAHKNGLFDSMHRELTRYQNGAMDKIVDTVAMDIIQLVDTTKGHVRVYEKKEPTEENYKRLVRIIKGIAEDLQDILYRQNIESYQVAGHEVDVRRQKIIQTIPTDDQTKDNLVAVRAAEGYEKNGKVLRPERIKIFKYNPDAQNSAPEN